MTPGREGPGERATRATRRRGGRPGQSVVELALIATVLSLFILGAFEFGRAFIAWLEIGNMARAGAQYGSMGAFLSPGDDVHAIQAKMADAAMAELGSSQSIWGREPVVTVNAIFKDPASLSEPGMDPTAVPECIAMVRVEYDYQPIFTVPGLPSSVRLARTAQMRVQFRPWYDPTTDPAGGCEDTAP